MKGHDLLSLSFRVIGLLFSGIGAIVAATSIVFVVRSDAVSGTVVDYSVEQNAITFMQSEESTGMLYYPIVEYPRPDGTVATVTGRAGRTSRPYEIGSSLTVLVSPRDPGAARINTVFGVWGSAIILGGLGALFLVLSVLTPYGFGGTRGRPERS